MSLTPRVFRSLKTFIQNLAPSVPSIHSPRMSRVPSGSTPERQVDRLVAHHRVLADLHAQRVEEHHRVHRLERPRLPGGDLGHDGVGDRADELGRDLHAVAARARSPWISRIGHAARVHGHDLVVEAGEAPLVLGDEQRLEAAVAIARHLHTQWTIVGEHRLGAGAVAVEGPTDRRTVVRPRRPRPRPTHSTRLRYGSTTTVA